MNLGLTFIKKRAVQKERSDDNFDDDLLIKELKYMAIEGLENVINEYNLSGRKLTGLLTILEETFNNCKITLSTSNKFDDEEFNLLLNAYSTIVIETIQELKLAIYSEGKKFNIKRFFQNIKKENNVPNSKKSKITPIDIGLEKIINDDEMDELEEDEYEENSEYETSDGENDSEYDSDSDECSSDNEMNVDEKNINKKFMLEFNKSIMNTKNSKDEIMRYFCDLEYDKKTEVFNQLNSVNNYLDSNKPILFKILNLPLDIHNKKSY